MNLKPEMLWASNGFLRYRPRRARRNRIGVMLYLLALIVFFGAGICALIG
jgi:hypothetical protein